MNYTGRENAIFLTGERGSVLIDFYGTTAVYSTARHIPKKGEIMCKDGKDKST